MTALRPLAGAALRRIRGTAWRLAGALGFEGASPPVSFVVEKADWSIRWDGLYITNHVNDLVGPETAGIVTDPAPLRRRVVHFGSQFLWTQWWKSLSSSNRFAVTFFHGKREDGPDMARHVDQFLESLPRLGRVLTACSLTEARLLAYGVPRERLVRIPIGVDTGAFSMAGSADRAAAKAALGLPADSVVIGSFQKDGVGWGDGMEPKMIKGPDIFIEAVGRIAKEHPVHVLLTGPARGYVKAGLERLGVPYRHLYLDDYRRIVQCYHALDLYLMTSREEGGPKAIMESMATGTPLVASACGMAPDLIADGRNGALVPVGDAAAAANRALDLLADRDRLGTILAVARQDVVATCDWRNVAEAHWHQVYAPLAAELGR